jgi:hypothetical protein
VHVGRNVVFGLASEIDPTVELKDKDTGEEVWMLGFVENIPDGTVIADFFAIDEKQKAALIEKLTGGVALPRLVMPPG